MTRRTILMSAATLMTGLGLSAGAAQQKASTALPPVTVFKTPT